MLRLGQRIYRVLEALHRWLYRVGLLDRVHLKVPVISVGNLTVGGTGKTPFVQFLLSELEGKGLSVGVVSLNYEAQVKSAQRVDPEREDSGAYYGDEPALIAEKFPHIPVYVGPRKWESALALQKAHGVDVIVVDDAFQHHALHRELDFVLLDASAKAEDLELLPVGRAREPLTSLERADFVVLTRVNQSDELWLDHLESLAPSHLHVLKMSSQLQGAFLEEAGKKVFAFAGIGRPESFETSLKSEAFYELVGFQGFPDHHSYNVYDLNLVQEKARQLGAELIVTTEKDAVKIRSLGFKLENLRVLPLEFKPVDGLDKFRQFLDEQILEWESWKKSSV